MQKNIKYYNSKYEVLKGADALILLTEWKEFRSPDFEEIKTQLKLPIIFDGRNQYNAFNLEDNGFEYFQIGKQFVMNKHTKIYIAGHRGMVGSAVWRALEKKGYTNLIGKTSKELDLKNQVEVS